MNDELDYAAAIERISIVARQFCTTIDDAPNLNRTVLLSRMYEVLPSLIGLAISLPDVSLDEGSEDGEIPKRTLSTHDEWKRRYRLLGENLGDWDAYWEIFDPISETDSVGGTLADDLADIYRDIGEFLDNPNSQPIRRIWHLRFSFTTHWGKHAIDALKVIHTRIHYH